MLGHIESYDNDRQTGVIKANDKFFEFYIDNWTADTPPNVGDDVDFIEEEEDGVSDVGLIGEYIKNDRPVKKRLLAAILGLFLGAFGVHRIYLGFYVIGIAQITITVLTAGFGIVWGIIESGLLFSGHISKDAKGRALLDGFDLSTKIILAIIIISLASLIYFMMPKY